MFEEEGFLHDNLYPLTFVDGNRTVQNQGCKFGGVGGANLTHAEFCPVGVLYDRYAPTKQGLLCKGASAMEVILGHKSFQVKNGLSDFFGIFGILLFFEGILVIFGI